MKAKTKDGIELEGTVEEIRQLIYGRQPSNVPKMKEEVKEDDDLKGGDFFNLSTHVLNTIRKDPMMTFEELSRKLNLPISRIVEVTRKFGGIRGIRKSMKMPLVKSHVLTNEHKEHLKFMTNRAREIMNSDKNISKKEAFKKASEEYKKYVKGRLECAQ